METAELRAKVEDEVLDTLRSVLRDFGKDSECDSTTILHGKDSQVDSVTLVHFIAELENRLASRLGMTLSLVSEDSFSGEAGPFRDVPSVVAHILRLAEQDAPRRTAD